jgi:DedD protein
MNGVFDEEELQPVQCQSDAELTLGPCKLAMLFLGLVLLCGFCFGVGYLMGHRGSKTSLPVNPQQGVDASSQTINSTPKPSAAPPSVSKPQSATYNPPPSEDSGSASAADAQNSDSPLPFGANSASSAQSAAAGQTTASRRSGSALMVQIAAVSQQEDADVLVGALRRRGYPVVERRDPADSLIHVQIGPFTSRGDANRWRQKLLNSGYNAIVQP